MKTATRFTQLVVLMFVVIMPITLADEIMFDVFETISIMANGVDDPVILTDSQEMYFGDLFGMSFKSYAAFNVSEMPIEGEVDSLVLTLRILSVVGGPSFYATSFDVDPSTATGTEAWEAFNTTYSEEQSGLIDDAFYDINLNDDAIENFETTIIEDVDGWRIGIEGPFIFNVMGEIYGYDEVESPTLTVYYTDNGPLPLAEPTDVSAEELGDGCVQISWTDPNVQEDGYRVSGRNKEFTDENWSLWTTMVFTEVDDTSYTYFPTEDGDYQYRVRAEDGPDFTDWVESNEIEVHVTPAAPTEVVAVALPPNQIDLTWNDNATNETFYTVEMRFLADEAPWSDYIIVDTLPMDAVSFSESELLHATYQFRVSCGNDLLSSASVETESVAILSAPVTPDAFSGIYVEALMGVQLSWDENSVTAESYTIERRYYSGEAWSTWGVVADLDAGVAGYLDPVELDGEYQYRIMAVSAWGMSDYAEADVNVLDVDEMSSGIPFVTALSKTYPNPFNGTVSVQFELSESSAVNFRLFNIAGQMVKTIVAGNMSAGSHQLSLNLNNTPSGTYIIRMKAGGFVEQRKIVLMK